jgi:uncharacterized protein
MHQQSAAKSRCTRGDPALFLPYQNDPGSADGRDLLRMKRAKPAANLPNQPVQPEKQSGISPQTTQGQPGKQADVAVAGRKSESESIPLGLSTGSASSQPPSEAPAKAEPQPKPRVERSRVPAILLEGDENKSAPVLGPIRKFTGPEPREPARTSPPQQGLPESYGTGRLLLTARDPRSLYAHWDLTAEQRQQENLRLRVHRESLSGPIISEAQVPEAAHHSFVQVDAPGARRFVAELGYYPAEGSWRTLAAAETAAIFSAPPAAEPIQFKTLSFGDEKRASPGAARPERQGEPVASLLGSGTATAARRISAFPLPEPLRSGNLKEGMEAKVPAVKLSQRPPEFFGEENTTISLDESLEMFEQLNDAADEELALLGQPWSAEQERALAELIGWTVVRNESFASEGIAELLRGMQGEKQAVPGELSSRSSAGVPVGVSSAELVSEAVPDQRGFWFNVNAELVIYGATQPGSRVTIGSRTIKLRPDGTFSYRFALPDGKYELPLAAHSTNGEERAATLEFSRQTVCSAGTGAHPPDPTLRKPTVENVG